MRGWCLSKGMMVWGERDEGMVFVKGDDGMGGKG